MRTCALFLAAAALTLAVDAELRSAVAAENAPETPSPAVGTQYDGAHVYLAPADMDAFVKSFVATFGGEAAAPAATTVTPTPSGAMFAPVRTSAGPLSVLAFTTPIPWPFGAERVGYLVKDLDAAVAAAVAAGAGVVVAPFADPIGRDAIVEWPGGAIMQLYWHTAAPSFPPLATVPEQRVYLSREKADAFVDGFLQFSKGVIVSDEPAAPCVEIGRPGETFRRVRIASGFGRLAAFVTDGHLPFPFGRETYSYEVGDVAQTLEKATAAGANVLVMPYKSDGREAAMVQFPGGYIAEIHADLRP
jgi:predicted enzyme related to lactoylglutathione lyase